MFEELQKLLWQPIVRPFRDVYTNEDLGGKRFTLENDMEYQRSDFVVKNKMNNILVASHFEPIDKYKAIKKLPCVIYLHGNASSRLEALSCVRYVLKLNMSIVCFDFSGCGNSEGEYVTLGYKEVDDLSCIINYITINRNVGKIALWGRSMGAVTAVRYASINKNIACLVLDSPYYSLPKLINELSYNFLPINIPDMMRKLIIGYTISKIKEKTGMDINELTLENVKIEIPFIVIYAINDELVNAEHMTSLYRNNVDNHSYLMEVYGTHNSLRSKIVYKFLAKFLFDKIGLATDLDKNKINVKSKYRTYEAYLTEQYFTSQLWIENQYISEIMPKLESKFYLN